MSSPAISVALLVLTVAAVVFYSARYLPEYTSLFVTISVTRLGIAMFAGGLLFVVLLAINAFLKKKRSKSVILNLSMLVAALTAIAMVAASWGHTVPESVLELYQPRQ